MANFFTGSIYNYYSNLPKLKGVLYEGGNVSALNNDAGYITSASITASYVNPLRQNVIITGSLNITGSTTQIGNNTLLGNTTLSGSIIISGSTTVPATPTIKIYGDMETNGVIKFNPVVKNIDTSISASYIYVSGSTNDLYFSQNGAGYNNVTRLRWLEGNLYTGLLDGGIISATTGSTTYRVSSGSGIIVTMNASYTDNPYPTVKYINWGNLSASIAPLSASYDQSFIAINANAQITASGVPYNDGDYNTKIPIGIVIHQNHSTINASQTFPGVAYGWKQRSFDFIKAFGPLKISGYTLSPSGSSTRGLVLSGGVSWVDGRNYIVDPNNPSYITEATGIVTSKIYRYRQSGSDWAYDTNGGAGYTTIDPTQYSLNGVLTPVGSNKWTIQRVFYFPNSATKAFYIYYGNAEYANQSTALAATLTEAFTEAPNTAANAIYVGYMLLRDDANFTVPASYAIQEASLFRAAGSGGGSSGGVTTPGGSTTQIQYNNAGAFGGVTNLTWDGTTLRATGSFTGSFTGSLLGTSSYATTSSATTAFDGAWTSYTPAWTTDGTQPSIGNGTITGAYKQIGKTVFVRVKLNAGSSTNFGSGAFQFSLPVTASSPDGIQFPCSMLDNGIHWYQGTVNGTYSGNNYKSAIIYPNTSGWSDAVTSTAPFTWGNTDSLQFNGSYESV
jgi:hypothetical protein